MNLEDRATNFLAANPRVWNLFVRFTHEAIAAGHRHCSADMILHRIRWETSVATAGGPIIEGRPLRVSNDLTPYLARKFHAENPNHADFFRLRPVKPKSNCSWVCQKCGRRHGSDHAIFCRCGGVIFKLVPEGA